MGQNRLTKPYKSNFYNDKAQFKLRVKNILRLPLHRAKAVADRE